MNIRLECTAAGLENNWIEIADVWARAELRAWRTAALQMDEEALYGLMRQKIVKAHVHTVDGDLLATADDLVARLDDLDVRISRWLGTSIDSVLKELLLLGEASKRLLFDGVDVAATTKTTPTAKST